ncbi:unnamed protein product [Larinioides sclopetarius]|uniref:Uncharacterized protein n=1 Tax=Larinioides sclopetarius TaxID=280406 RepID=A0AAV2ADJ1_9ARAC
MDVSGFDQFEKILLHFLKIGRVVQRHMAIYTKRDYCFRYFVETLVRKFLPHRQEGYWG